MTIRIGIIGAENSHAAAIAKTFNIEKAVADCAVTHIWGETREFAERTAKAGRIPNIVEEPEEMLGKVDGIMVDHRHAKYHLAATRPFVEKGVPAFIDKPFCYRSEEGRKFLKLARENGAAVATGSLVPLQKTYLAFQKELADLGAIQAGSTCAPCDIDSKYGGIFFYGIHSVEIALRAFGFDVEAALVTRNGRGSAAQLIYPSGLIVTMNLIKSGYHSFSIGAYAEKNPVIRVIEFDKQSHLPTAKMMARMFRTNKSPDTEEEILRPIEVLEALERSVKWKQKEPVGPSDKPEEEPKPAEE